MNRRDIEILVMRISPDGKFLEFIINCPEEYHFTEFLIKIEGRDDTYSISESLFETEGEEYRGAVKLSDLNVTEPEIYHITLKAELDESNEDEESEESSCECNELELEIIVEAHISDVSNVYKCLIDKIISYDADCRNEDLKDEVIRDYLILYGHQEALKLKFFDEAKKWFLKLKKCFTECGSPKNTIVGGCGCQVKQIVKPSCGCGR